MAKAKRGKGATLFRKGKSLTGALYVSFRHPLHWQDPQDKKKGHRIIRRSLRTSKITTAENYVQSLNRIINDPKLWKVVPNDTPEIVRTLWLGDAADFKVETNTGGVSLRWSSNLEKMVKIEIPDDLSDPVTIREVFRGNPKATTLAEELLKTRNELDTTRESNDSLAQEMVELRDENKALRLKLNQYNRRAAKAASVGTLTEEADKYLEDYNKRKVTNSRKGITRNTIDRFVKDVGADRQVDDISEKELSKYIQSYRKKSKDGNVQGQPISEERRKAIRGALCSLLESATDGVFDRKRVVSISAHAVDREKRVPVWLDEGEAARLITEVYRLSGSYWGDLLTVQFHTGFRPSELTILQKDLIIENSIQLVPVLDEATGAYRGKTGARSVSIHKNIKSIINNRIDMGNSPLLFPFLSKQGEGKNARRKNNAKGLLKTAWTLHAFSKQYAEVLRNAATAAKIKKPIDTRTPRRTFGSLCLRQGATEHEVAVLLGNQAKIVRRHYAQLCASEIQLPSFGILAKK